MEEERRGVKAIEKGKDDEIDERKGKTKKVPSSYVRLGVHESSTNHVHEDTTFMRIGFCWVKTCSTSEGNIL